MGEAARRSAAGQREPFLRRFAPWDYVAFALLTALQLTVFGVAVGRGFSAVLTSEHPVVVSVLLASILVEVLLWEWRWVGLPLMRVPERVAARDGWRVAAAITFVPGAESVDMLDETLRAVVAIRYPHDTWVLDEGDAPEVRDLCARHGARHFTRKHEVRYQADRGPFASRTKYGNYNAWLDARGYYAYELVVAFDSDHIPRPEYLDEVLGYFEDAQVAYVQPAQAYYNQRSSFIARAAAEETYAYYSSIQMSGYAVEHPIVVGCHNTHRVTAMREIGGFPAHEADDMVMTLRYRAAGWRGVYVPRILARGLTPVDWQGYLRQQRRWARSVLDYSTRLYPKDASRLPFLERVLGYLHGTYYLRGLLIASQLFVLLYLLTAWTPPPGNGLDLLAFIGLVTAVVALSDFYKQRFFLDRRSEWGLHWRGGFVSFVKWPWLVVAVIDALRGRYGDYTTTIKARSSRRATEFAIVHAMIAAAVGVAWGIGSGRGPSSFVPLHVATFFVMSTSLLAVATVAMRFPPPWDPQVRRRWDERAGTLDSGEPAPTRVLAG